MTRRSNLALLLCAAGLWFFTQGGALAHTFGEEEFTCPLDGTKFKATVDLSGTSFGSRLDLKPIGPTAAPWRLPVCPMDHFIVVRQDYTEAERDLLKNYVRSQEYRDLAKTHSTYFLLAKIYEVLGEDDWKIAEAYLQGSWQVEARDAECMEYLEASLLHAKRFLEKKPKHDETWKTAEMLSGELERRLGRFEEAQKRFKRLRRLSEFKEDRLARIIRYQLNLIKWRNTLSQKVPEPGREDRRPFPRIEGWGPSEDY